MILPEFGKPLPAGEKRIILGKPTQQLFPLKYPWMWEAYKDAQANHWLPDDIAMGKDRDHYHNKLTDAERRMYDWCLAMLTTQDLLVMGNLEEGIERHLTVPEASMYLARQTDEEAIHTQSYQHVVESLSLAPEDVYEKYLRERSLYAKVEYAYKHHRRLLELRMDDHSGSAGISEFLECLAFWTIGLEGGFFYQGFNFVYALGRRGLMPGTVEMFLYIMRDEAGHFQFWINVMNTIIAEHPEAYTKTVRHNIAVMAKDVAHLEEVYAYDACQNVLGITATDYMSHFRYFTNNNLNKLGIPPVFTGVQPMAWVAEMVDHNKERNFFETRVTEYSKAGLGWDDSVHVDDFASPMRK